MFSLLKLSKITIITLSLNLILFTIPKYILAQNAPDCSQVEPNDKSNECNRQANIEGFVDKKIQESKRQMEISRQVRNFINPEKPPETTEAQPEEEPEKKGEPPEPVQITKTIEQIVSERRQQEEKELFRRLVEASKRRNISNKGRKARRTFGRAIEPYKRP